MDSYFKLLVIYAVRATGRNERQRPTIFFVWCWRKNYRKASWLLTASQAWPLSLPSSLLGRLPFRWSSARRWPPPLWEPQAVITLQIIIFLSTDTTTLILPHVACQVRSRNYYCRPHPSMLIVVCCCRCCCVFHDVDVCVFVFRWCVCLCLCVCACVCVCVWPQKAERQTVRFEKENNGSKKE